MANFRANPTANGKYPGLIVIQEFWGVNDHIKDITQRLANEGFVALAVDLYDGRIARSPQEAMQMLQSLDQKATLGKLVDAVEALKGDPQAAGKVGVIGFCMGGFYALLLAANNSDISAAAPFYGRVPPTETLEKITAPVLYVYAGKDDHIPVSEPNRMLGVLQKKGVPAELKIYPEAHHAFMNDSRKEVYKADDAADAWKRAVSFLRQHLTAQANP
jgi:carboxymethylenebutenolidase